MSSLAGSFLVARHTLQDPNFLQTVILVLKHGPEGTFGLVVNRQTQMDDVPFPVFSGGPCPMEGFIVLHGHEDWLPASQVAELTVAEGIYLGDASCVTRLTDSEPAHRVRVFSGYAGWGPEQLEGELAAGAWAVLAASGMLLFDTPADELWDNLVPPRIPRPSVN